MSRAASAGVRSAYFGTSEFAAAILRGLAASPHAPRLVVAPPDRRRGRGRKVAPPPVAAAARELGIELHQTESVNREESRAAIAAADPGLGLVCAFGQLIREPLLAELPMLNVHPSLLPRWRGAAPIERAIMAGDERTGVCVMRLTAGLDSGPVALRAEAPIGAADDYGTLSVRLAELGGELLVEALDRFAAGRLELTEQDEEGATYAEKIEPNERRVDHTRPAAAEARRVRALSPHIGAHVELAGSERLGVRGAEPLARGPAPGAFEVEERRLVLGCMPGALAFAEVQPAGGRWMAADAYVRGRGVPTAALAP